MNKNQMFKKISAIVTRKKASNYNDNTSTMSAVELNNMGLALHNSGKYKEALKWYRKSLSINPNDATVWNNAGIALYTLSNYGDAAKYFANAITRNPNNAITWGYMGNTYYAIYTNTITRNPFDATIWAYVEIAIKCYDKSLSINPNDASVWKNKSVALNELRLKLQGPAYPQQGLMSKRIETELANLGMKDILGG
jgi:tetratricopeptide (TPR) repeat protein